MPSMTRTNGKASDAAINKARYGDLLRETLPRPIRTEAENERHLRVVEHLMSLGKRITPEQRELLGLLVLLIERFEAERYALSPASPVEALRELMQQRSMKLADLAALIGSTGVASEILNGKRALSKANIKRLAGYFGVSPELFL
jgi:HTH-type transcriptional regulator/antitoxin HigA